MVNQYRVEEACKMFDDPTNKHITIEGIAQNVGFHSKSAFNSAFKKIMTVTPSEYLAFRSRMESDVNQTG
jgi:AraC-like DNA-binding protein